MSADLINQVKRAILKYKIHFILLIALSILVSSYQGKVISLSDTSEERHGEIFSEKLKIYFSTGEYVNSEIQNHFENIKDIYKLNNHKPLWTINYAGNSNFTEFISLLAKAKYYGLSSKEYSFDKIKEIEKSLISEQNYIKLTQNRIDFEIVLTYSCLRFYKAMQYGILYERDNQSLNDSEICELIVNKLNNKEIAKSILEAQPTSVQYKRLQKALERIIQTVSFDLLEKEMLNAEEIMPAQLSASNILNIIYNEEYNNINFKSRVIKFQRMEKLEETGKLDKNTRMALLDEFNQKYEKIALNLERLRQDNRNTDTYILVNIPAFNLSVYEKNNQVAIYKTIIGKPLSPTPIFSARIEKIVTNPSWIVPQSISSKEILYRVKKDSTFLSRNNYLVFDKDNNEIDPGSINWDELNPSNFNYRIIQQSSEGNALGKIKFLFPNKYSVYVHDTPSKRLFDKDYRAFSHGCVRLQNPYYLAEYIIKKQENPKLENKLKYDFKKGVQEIFELSYPIEIHIRYYTCEANEKGNITFYNDVYNLDSEIINKIRS